MSKDLIFSLYFNLSVCSILPIQIYYLEDYFFFQFTKGQRVRYLSVSFWFVIKLYKLIYKILIFILQINI